MSVSADSTVSNALSTSKPDHPGKRQPQERRDQHRSSTNEQPDLVGTDVRIQLPQLPGLRPQRTTRLASLHQRLHPATTPSTSHPQMLGTRCRHDIRSPLSAAAPLSARDARVSPSHVPLSARQRSRLSPQGRDGREGRSERSEHHTVSPACGRDARSEATKQRGLRTQRRPLSASGHPLSAR